MHIKQITNKLEGKWGFPQDIHDAHIPQQRPLPALGGSSLYKVLWCLDTHAVWEKGVKEERTALGNQRGEEHFQRTFFLYFLASLGLFSTYSNCSAGTLSPVSGGAEGPSEPPIMRTHQVSVVWSAWALRKRTPRNYLHGLTDCIWILFSLLFCINSSKIVDYCFPEIWLCCFCSNEDIGFFRSPGSKVGK